MPIRYQDQAQKDAAHAEGLRLSRQAGAEQFRRDVDMWTTFLDQPGDANLGLMVRRLFQVLHYGGLFYRPSKNVPGWAWFRILGAPAAAALSHGGRVLIQLPQADPQHFQRGQHDDSFKDWLFPGVRPMARVATHGINNCNAVQLPARIAKNIKEEKGFKQALRPSGMEYKRWHFMRFAKGLKRGQDVRDHVDAEHHRHWGLNVALGGVGNPRLSGVGQVEGDGGDGHMYIYYRAPKVGRFGALLIGVEGCAPQVWDQFGHFHGSDATSADISPTGGGKWRNLAMGPVDAFDDLFVNLSHPGKMQRVRDLPFHRNMIGSPPQRFGAHLSIGTFMPNRNGLEKMLKKARQSDHLKGAPERVEHLFKQYHLAPNAYIKRVRIRMLQEALETWDAPGTGRQTKLAINQLKHCVRAELHLIEWEM